MTIRVIPGEPSLPSGEDGKPFGVPFLKKVFLPGFLRHFDWILTRSGPLIFFGTLANPSRAAK